MKIHIADGTVLFDKGDIGPRLDKPSFLKSRIGKASETIVTTGPFVTFRFHPEPGISGAARFENNRLNELSVLFHMPSDDAREWTEELELARKKVHDEWLHTELGAPPYRFSWGEVASVFDPKGCVSDIIVRYAK